jgi:transposase InsO family protein
MKIRDLGVGLGTICKWFNISRQAYYQKERQNVTTCLTEDLILLEVEKTRKLHPRMGGRKLYFKLSVFMKNHHIKMGRDAFFKLLSDNMLLVGHRRRRVRTTDSSHWMRKYPNLIKNFAPTAPNQLWVSDITYWLIGGYFLYISFITDAYSHKIVGYCVADSLSGLETLKALKMVLTDLKKRAGTHSDLIHHSDRGTQYCQHQYVELLQKNNIKISMTESGDPRDNAVAERLNGIIKNEYLKWINVGNLKQAKKVLKHIVHLYNTDRPHNSISNLYPNDVHEQNLETEKKWATYYKKKTGLTN